MILPSPLLWVLALALALLFGSFLNVCIARLPQHRSIARPGSHCPRCQAPVQPRDNVPILSWLLLRGRCRACGRPISLRYPLVEAGYTALVAASIARFGFSAEALAASIFSFLLLGLLVMDLETMLLPDAFTLPGIALGLAWALVAPASLDNAFPSGLPTFGIASGPVGMMRFEDAALSAAAWALLLLAIRWGYYAVRRRHGLGLGDVKLVAMMGAWLGASQTALCFLIGVVSAAVYGLALITIRLKNKASGEGEGEPKPAWGGVPIPLGAFLCGGGLAALFFGKRMLQWYFSLWL